MTGRRGEPTPFDPRRLGGSEGAQEDPPFGPGLPEQLQVADEPDGRPERLDPAALDQHQSVPMRFDGACLQAPGAAPGSGRRSCAGHGQGKGHREPEGFAVGERWGVGSRRRPWSGGAVPPHHRGTPVPGDGGPSVGREATESSSSVRGGMP